MTALLPPRWPAGPPICSEHNLPCFESREDAYVYIARYCPGAKVYRLGKCDTCGMFHFAAKMRSPSGDSSGSSRR